MRECVFTCRGGGRVAGARRGWRRPWRWGGWRGRTGGQRRQGSRPGCCEPSWAPSGTQQPSPPGYPALQTCVVVTRVLLKILNCEVYSLGSIFCWQKSIFCTQNKHNYAIMQFLQSSFIKSIKSKIWGNIGSTSLEKIFGSILLFNCICNTVHYS